MGGSQSRTCAGAPGKVEAPAAPLSGHRSHGGHFRCNAHGYCMSDSRFGTKHNCTRASGTHKGVGCIVCSLDQHSWSCCEGAFDSTCDANETANPGSKTAVGTWEYDDGHRGWQLIGGPAEQAQLEAAYQAGQSTQQFDFGRWTYRIDLFNMTQTNLATGKARAVRRSTGGQPGDKDSRAATAGQQATITLCAICHEDLSTSPSDLSCGHQFHPGCLQDWAKTNASCPICRADLPAEYTPADPARTTCSICCEDKLDSEFEGNFTSRCNHTRDICNECCQRHISAEVRGKGNAARIQCPTCDSVLQHSDVQRFATPADFTSYDDVLIKQTLQAMAEFRWCSRAGCGSGQLVEGCEANPIMTCAHCRAKTCYTHRVEWHEGKTCAQYDKDKAQSEEAELVHLLETTTKRCPGCNTAIEKNDGCDHMTCRKSAGGCGFEFCWRCGADYNGPSGIRAVGNGAHKPTCTWYR